MVHLQRKQQDLSIIESHEFLKSILDTTTDHIVVIDHEGNIVFANHAWNSFGQNNDCLIDNDWKGVNYLTVCDESAAMGDELSLAAADGIRKVINAEQASFYLEYPCHGRDERRWFMMRVTSFTLRGTSYFVIAHKNITERKEAELELVKRSKQLEHLALYDTLSGLGNRNLFLKQLEHLIAIAGRKKEEVALLVMDLDGFKEVNDRLGHAGGDAVLQEFGIRLSQALREADQKYRIGGDEFAVLLEPRHESRDGAFAVAEKIAGQLRTPMEIKGYDCAIGVSIGVAIFPEHGEDPNTLLRKADAAMYEAKKTHQVVAGASDLDATTILKRLHVET